MRVVRVCVVHVLTFFLLHFHTRTIKLVNTATEKKEGIFLQTKEKEMAVYLSIKNPRLDSLTLRTF